MTVCLGLNLAATDPSAALAEDGCLISHCDEERLSRRKHAPGDLPLRSILWMLKDSGLSLNDVDGISVGWDLDFFESGAADRFFANYNSAYPVDENTRNWQANNIKNYSRRAIAQNLKRSLLRAFPGFDLPPIIGLPHHTLHAKQSIAWSGYEDCLAVVIDGSGETFCTSAFLYRNNAMHPLVQIPMPNSLGWFYSAITEYLGFSAYDGEYKVMGLAPYGSADREISNTLTKVLDFGADGSGYRVDGAFIHWGDHSYSDRFTDSLIEILGRPPRHEAEPVSDWHKNLAFCAQELLENTVVRLVSNLVREHNCGSICLSGGVAHNVKLMQAISNIDGVERFFSDPICGDNGLAAGAAVFASLGHEVLPPLHELAPFDGTFIFTGPGYSDSDYRACLDAYKIEYSRPERMHETCAHLLAYGAIIGWFNGRMEGGSRALGNRSILADPRQPDMAARVNRAVKYREAWRPFCPSICADYSGDYLINTCADMRFMTTSTMATKYFRQLAPSVVHIDGTTRPQIVFPKEAPHYYELLKSFGSITGLYALLNTSFNLSNEPIVCSPTDAIRTFFSSGLDFLALGPYLVAKTNGN